MHLTYYISRNNHMESFWHMKLNEPILINFFSFNTSSCSFFVKYVQLILLWFYKKNCSQSNLHWTAFHAPPPWLIFASLVTERSERWLSTLSPFAKIKYEGFQKTEVTFKLHWNWIAIKANIFVNNGPRQSKKLNNNKKILHL